MTTLPPQFEEIADLVWALVNDRLDAAGASPWGNCSKRTQPIGESTSS